jgi:hypothetical protein
MGTLVSPGVSVTVTDESFFIPVSAPTVPLFFIATADDKVQPNGSSPAEGTMEYGVIRTITSMDQSLKTYGVPRFLEDTNGAQYHGDARNEYGLFALNQFLGVGNRAYVVRANVNLDDSIDGIRTLWDKNVQETNVVLQNLISQYINEWNTTNNLLPEGSPAARTTVDSIELISLVNQASQDLFNMYSFQHSYDTFMGNDSTPLALDVYADGYDAPITGVYDGFSYIATNIGMYPGYPGGDLVTGEFTAQEGGELFVSSADDYKYINMFRENTSLGANDAARRAAITTAFQAAINSNTDIRSENFDYNLILTPGYWETIDECLALVQDIQDEALVIADCPSTEDPDGITNPATGWGITPERQRSTHVAYYYPWALASNFDGINVVVAPSGIALRTYAYSDDVSYLWYAPAGIRRGVITGVSRLGYVEGVIGGPTTFVEVNLNQGQRDALYQYENSGDINPLVFFPGSGFLVWGQKTSAPAASAMDRVNVSRLIKYIKRQLRRNTLSFVFEPNDQLTRDSLKAVVDNFLGDLIVKRGLYDFATICDESNNTPDRIDRNEMYIDVALKPVKAAEFIYIPIRVVATGAEI